MIADLVESKLNLKYVKMGLFDCFQTEVFNSLSDIEGIGVAASGDNAQNASYLVTDGAAPVNIREAPQRRGGVKYALTQFGNPQSIEFSPGGEFSDLAIISGRIATISTDLVAKNIFLFLIKH